MPDTEAVAQPYPRLLEWLRYLCALLLYLYGASKLAHFQFHMQAELAPRPIGSLNGYQLTWFYYGYSRTYALTLGVMQLLGDTLLLFRKSALLGAAMLVPMMANVLLINIFFLTRDLGRGPLFTSAFILDSMLILLWHQRAKLFFIFWTTQPAELEDSQGLHRWVRFLILLAVASTMIAGLFLQHRYGHKP